MIIAPRPGNIIGRLLALAGLALVLEFAWEMAQVPFFANLAALPLARHVGTMPHRGTCLNRGSWRRTDRGRHLRRRRKATATSERSGTTGSLRRTTFSYAARCSKASLNPAASISFAP